MLSVEKIEGLVAAPFTPMYKDGSLNTDLVPEYYNFLLKNGIKGAFINGSSGEGVSLSGKEKITHAEKWTFCSRKNPGMKIIALVGGTSYNECIENAISYKEAGVSAIAVLSPYYFKPGNVEKLAEFCARVGASVPDLPVYFYNIPFLTGVNLPMIEFLKAISKMLPNFAGIKYTHEDFMDFLLCLRYDDGKYDMLWGRDECMLSSLVLGCKGAVGSTFNYAAPLYYKMIDAYNSGDMETARKLQHKSIEMIQLLGKYGGIATGKAYMKFVGVDCGEFRLPVTNMSEETLQKFFEDVKKLQMSGLFSSR